MYKMFEKNRIFYYALSFFIIFVIGFFVWSLFVSSNKNIVKNILSEVQKINSKFFKASLSPDYTNNIILTTDEGGKVIEDNLVDESDLGEQNTDIVIEESFQDKLDDIREKLDTISQQVQLLIDEQNEKLDEEEMKDEDEEIEHENEKVINCIGQININTAFIEDLEKISQVGSATAQKIIQARPFYLLNDLLKVSGIKEATLQKIIQQGCAYVEPGLVAPAGNVSTGSALTTIYPKILISEVQILPINQRFVELYNPNSVDINLTDWYLQRKTSSQYASFITKSDFLGKVIKANNYFLISRSDTTADILLADLTITANNHLALKSSD